MDLNAFTRREEELDRREAVLEHRAMVLEAELGRLSGEPTYTSDQVRDAVQQHLLNRRRERTWLKHPLIYTKEALQDLLDIADYHFGKVGEDSALRAVGDLQDHIEKLCDFPPHGRGPPGYLPECAVISQAGSWQPHRNLSRRRRAGRDRAHRLGFQQLPGTVPLIQGKRKAGVRQTNRLCGWYWADACLFCFWELYRVIPLRWRCCFAQFLLCSLCGIPVPTAPDRHSRSPR